MSCATCTGASDVTFNCVGTCQVRDTCPSCVTCLGNNGEGAEDRHSCVGCDNCNTLCVACQAICLTTGQMYRTACENAAPACRWTDVSFNEPIVKVFPQGKFYWAWGWMENARQFGTDTPSPGTVTAPTPDTHLRAAHWDMINTALQSLKAGNSNVSSADINEKVTATKIVTAGEILLDMQINRIACHFQNTIWEECGPVLGECCQTCEACMMNNIPCEVSCQADTPVTCYYVCGSCNTCAICDTCQGPCNTCQGCDTCEGCDACTTCNNCNNCVAEETG